NLKSFSIEEKNISKSDEYGVNEELANRILKLLDMILLEKIPNKEFEPYLNDQLSRLFSDVPSSALYVLADKIKLFSNLIDIHVKRNLKISDEEEKSSDSKVILSKMSNPIP